MSDGVVIHFPGHDNLVTRPEDVPQRILNSHRYYLSQRGYSYGYSFVLDPWGEFWVVRGTDHAPGPLPCQNAANAGRKVPRNVNHTSVSVQVMTKLDGIYTAAQEAALREIIDWCDNQAGWRLPVNPHSTWDWTSCCGDPLRAWIAAGDLRPPTQKDNDSMRWHGLRIFDSRRDKGRRVRAGEVLTLSVPTDARDRAVQISWSFVEVSGEGHFTIASAGERSHDVPPTDRGSGELLVPVGLNGQFTFEMFGNLEAHVILDISGSWALED